MLEVSAPSQCVDVKGSGMATSEPGRSGHSAAAEATSVHASRKRVEPDTSTPQRKWAARHLSGLLNLFLPSFREDLHTLDEDAIRGDVRHALNQGFAGTLPMINWTPPEDSRWDEYYRIIIDEAQGRLPVHGILFGNRLDYDLRIIRRLQNLGVDLILLASTYPPGNDREDLHAAMSARIKATELPVMLYAALGKGRNFPHLGPAGQPLDVYDRLADLPNVAAVKISQPVSLMSTMQLCARLGDRLSMGPVNLDFVPLLARHYRISWSGQWNAEAVQTPSRQLGNTLLAASAAGDLAALDEAARDIQPVLEHFFALQAEVIRNGAHPWQHNKYYSWLGGGNGGLLPEDAHSPKGSVPALTASAREQIRNAFAASGLTVTDAPEEAFIVGRAAWDRGVRPSDMVARPHYEAG